MPTAKRRKASRASRKSRAQDNAATQWGSLTWANVEDWAGSRSVARGRSYQRQGRVGDLAAAEDGRLLATVTGGARYVVSVRLTGRGRSRAIESKCTCPVGLSDCKHAVAVVVAYLEALADSRAVPVAKPDDRRWTKLARLDADSATNEFADDFEYELDDELDDELEEEDDGYSDSPGGRRSTPARQSAKADDHGGKRRTRAEWDERIRTYIHERSQEELVALLESLVDRFGELRIELQEKISLTEGDVDRLVQQAQRELRAVTAEAGWQNHWDDEGHTPNYLPVTHKLERLVAQGHCDEVVELGRALIRRGITQIEQSHDDGETAMELAACLLVVFDALAKSNLSARDKILYAIDAHLLDDYDVIGESADPILEADWMPADWSAVADRLAQRVKKTPSGIRAETFCRDYQRDQITGWLLRALTQAGRNDELLPLYEAEARATGSYQRLVDYLLEQNRLKEAERWAHEGIERTQAKLPGIAAALRETLCDLARRGKEWDVVAAHAAAEFFEHPSVRGLRDLVAAAKKAKSEKPVRAAALKFLETGVLPVRVSTSRGGQRSTKIDANWPLPVPEYFAPAPEAIGPKGSAPQPHLEVLLDLAIDEKRHDDVLHWYERIKSARRQSARGRGGWYGGEEDYSDRVAAAVASSHPQQALAIYRKSLAAHLPQAHISAYETCTSYLGKMRPILTSLGRGDEWKRLLAEIRLEYRNRPRFMEILDKLNGRTIVETQKARRR